MDTLKTLGTSVGEDEALHEDDIAHKRMNATEKRKQRT